MPTYSYRCANCDYAFDQYQAFTDDSLSVCPNCGEPKLRKVFNSIGVTFNGSGFYRTDARADASAAKSKSNADSSSKSKESSSSDSSSKSDSKPSTSESKPSTSPAAKPAAVSSSPKTGSTGS
ncbi:FmdB family zinc ribbon protein [Glaciihabitans sp. UYNi722]|uniref:FmdB family zinc ribbon protein n=1 Tax=Glaciihabitans sp. UYNi722 TaxID=3156344 RepID=UPI003398AC9D